MNIQSKNIFECNIGLEKESLRVDEDGRFAQTDHPFLGNVNIDRDFCENQVEIITDPSGSARQAYLQIKQLHNFVIKELKKQGEYLWLFSNPPYFESDDEIPVAHFTGSLSYKEKYREYLANKYGKRKMLYSGIHYNFSFGDNLLKELFSQSGESDFFKFSNLLYLRLAKQIVHFSWLIVYLTAASPVFDRSFFERDAEKYLNEFSSARCSEIGYRNQFIPVLEYTDLSSYIKSIKHYVKTKQIIVESELYYPVRLKSSGANSLVTLGETGVNHIELRMFDLNPLSEAGIFEEDIAFIHLLLIFLSAKEDFVFSEKMQMESILKMYASAHFNDEEIKYEALSVLEEMNEFFGNDMPQEYKDAIKFQFEKIRFPERRYAFQIRKFFGEDFTKKGL
ncbi:MAG: hypothetical protein IJS17_01975, partial [Clostridia bacterium]|nr:hypothetical protein [Clostridia bacterium]